MDYAHHNEMSNSSGSSHIIFGSVAGAFAMALIIVGNLLVIVAILRFNHLRRVVQNWFSMSLAMSDMLLGLIVMPMSLTKELSKSWPFGQIMCQLWLAIDVLLCTAQINMLCLISLDRYWSVTDPINYPRLYRKTRVKRGIVVVWLLSTAVSVPPMIGKPFAVVIAGNATSGVTAACELTHDIYYVTISTVLSFYSPLFIMAAMYLKVAWIVKKQAQSMQKSSANKTPKPEECQEPKTADAMQQFYETSKMVVEPRFSRAALKEKLQMSQREKRTYRVLVLIMIVVILIWAPFFTIYLAEAFNMHINGDGSSLVAPVVFELFFWLGYCNAALDPLLYTFLSPDFQAAFKVLLREAWKMFKSFCCFKCLRKTSHGESSSTTGTEMTTKTTKIHTPSLKNRKQSNNGSARKPLLDENKENGCELIPESSDGKDTPNNLAVTNTTLLQTTAPDSRTRADSASSSRSKTSSQLKNSSRRSSIKYVDDPPSDDRQIQNSYEPISLAELRKDTRATCVQEQRQSGRLVRRYVSYV